jgi:3-oxoadipate enol-lactonase
MKALTRGAETIAYLERGQGPRALVLAHNLMCDHEVWSPVLAELAGSPPERVVSLDLRGHGGSTAHAPYAIADAAADLCAIVDAEGIDEVVVVGLSLGASVAMELLLADPARVRGAVLLAACGEAATRRESVRDAVVRKTIEALGFPGPIAAQTAQALFGATFRARAPDAVRACEAKLATLTPRFAAHALGAWSGRRAILRDLARVTQPVTVVVGEEDLRCPPADGEKVHAAIAGAHLVRLAATGHTMSVERPAEVARAVRELCARAFGE